MLVPGAPDLYKQVLDTVFYQRMVTANPASVTAQVIKIVVIDLGEGQAVTFRDFVPRPGWAGSFGGAISAMCFQGPLFSLKKGPLLSNGHLN